MYDGHKWTPCHSRLILTRWVVFVSRACMCACRGVGVCCQGRKNPCRDSADGWKVPYLHSFPAEGPRLGGNRLGSVTHI